MLYLKRFFKLADNYLIARIQKRASTAMFWYLPEPAIIKNKEDLFRYQNPTAVSPLYLIDYRSKLSYNLTNSEGIIVLPYDLPIGQQVNPEAAFQYALGLHDTYCLTQDTQYRDKFLYYADYFVSTQVVSGLWHYNFDWFNATAPWSSALAQARGASVMLRAFLLTNHMKYYDAAKNAFKLFVVLTEEGGFLHYCKDANCYYFEEYPMIPTGVINGFMAVLLGLWEFQYWLEDNEITKLWKQGIASLEKMLFFYSLSWWSLYDRDENSPIANVNSPRYHFLEIQYLQILSVISNSEIFLKEYEKRTDQYHNVFLRGRALSQKLLRKIIYK